MARKLKRSPAPLTARQLADRIDKARREGRFQQALELAKQLRDREPTPAHRELLLTVYLERAHQLRTQGQPRDARTVLDNVITLAGNEAAWLEKAAVELAACGEVRHALQVLDTLPESPARGRVLGHAADAAVQHGVAGRALLPEALQPAFDLVLQAFRQLEAGQDDAAREALQGVGLTSPFLEWKLFLRGLQAYYQNDDARALENWSRLTGGRVPARLASPFCFQIDPAFRAAQPPETQTRLRGQLDRLQGGGLVTPMRAVQAALHSEELPRAWRSAEPLVPALRREAPDLVPRLASCFYWAIIQFGQPQDINRHRRLFGAPPDDPDYSRLEALAREQMQHWDEAHDAWQQYEKSLANNPAFPGELGKRARALVWCRMGHNAAHIPDAEEVRKMPAYLRDDPDRPGPLKPTAEQCFKRSLELAPDQRETHEALFDYYRERHKDGPAEKAARSLLEHFPEHVPTLAALGDQYLETNKPGAALDFYRRALKVNPLDRKLRYKVGMAHQYQARAFAEAGRHDDARAEYQAAQAFDEGRSKHALYCKWAALEFKAGNPERAEELLRQAAAGPRLDVAFQMLIEAVRCKLPKELKKRFEKDFADALDAPAEAPAAAAALHTASAHRQTGVKYHGQKTHEKKLVTYLGRVPKDAFTEPDLRGACLALFVLQEKKAVERYTKLGERRFPESPYFPLILVQSFMPTGQSRRLPPPWQVVGPLKKAEEAARQHLSGDEQQAVLEQVERLRELLGVDDLFGGFFGPGMFEEIFERLGADDEDGDDED